MIIHLMTTTLNTLLRGLIIILINFSQSTNWGVEAPAGFSGFHISVLNVIGPASSTQSSNFIPVTPVTSTTALVTAASGTEPTKKLGQETLTGAASNGDPPANNVPTQSFSDRSPTSAPSESGRATHDSIAGARDPSQSLPGSVLSQPSIPAAVTSTSSGSAPAESVSQIIANTAATLPMTVASVVDPAVASAEQGSTASAILRPLSEPPRPGIGAMIMSAFGSQPPTVGSSEVVVPSLAMPLPAPTAAHQPAVDAAAVSNTKLGQILPDGSAAPLQSPPSDLVSQVFTIAGETFTADPTGFVIAGTTVSPGGPSAVISGTPVSLGPSGVIIGGSTMPLRAASRNQMPSVLTAAGEVVTANPIGFSLAGTAVSLGGPAVTISGTPVSLGSSNLVIGGSTFAIQTPTASRVPSVFTVAGQMFTANPTGFAIASVTVLPGSPAVTISGTPISLAPSGLIVGTSTFAQMTPPLTQSTQAGATLLPGSGITISGTPISLEPSGLVIGTSTIPLAILPPNQPTQSVFTVAGQVFTANPTRLSIAGTTLLSGSGMTVSVTPVSLGSSGLVIGTSTIALPTSPSNQPTQPVFTIAGQIITPNSTGFSIAGTTLLPSSEITRSGTIVSLGTSDVVIGNSTIALPTSTSSAQSSNLAVTSNADLSSNPAQVTETSAAGSTDAKTSPPHTTKGAASGKPLSLGYFGSLIWVMSMVKVRHWIL